MRLMTTQAVVAPVQTPICDQTYLVTQAWQTYFNSITAGGTSTGDATLSGTQSFTGKNTFNDAAPAVADGNALPTVLIKRDASQLSGGTVHNNNALVVIDKAGANETASEWAALIRMLNYSTTSAQNLALYAQTIRYGTSPSWGAVIELSDGQLTEGSAMVGLEVDIFASGTNSTRDRIGVNIIAGQTNKVAGATTCEVFAGLLLNGTTSGVGGVATGYYHNAVLIGQDPSQNLPQMTVTNAIRTAVNGTTLLNDTGNYVTGIALEGTYSGAAVSVPANTFISLDPTNTYKFKYNATNNHVEFYNGATLKHSISLGATPFAVGALVYQSASQLIQPNVGTLMSFNTVQGDNHGYYNSATPTELIANVAGWYTASAFFTVQGTSSSAFSAMMAIRKNGSSAYIGVGEDLVINPGGSTNGIILQATTAQVYMNVGDYFQVNIIQTSGVNFSTDPTRCWFQMVPVQ